MIAASKAVRGTMLVRSTHSAGPWSSPPTGPRPSMVGVPAELVVFASEAPPVAASRSSNPSSDGGADGDLHEAPRALALLHRAMPAVHVDRDAHVRDGDVGADPLHLGLGLLQASRAPANGGRPAARIVRRRRSNVCRPAPPRRSRSRPANGRSDPAGRGSCEPPAGRRCAPSPAPRPRARLDPRS